MNNSQRVSRQHRDSKLRNAIEAAVYKTIFENDSFIIDVPKLSPDLWERVSIPTPTNREENERLEFLGDALMDSSIAISLYKCVPSGTPHKYTVMLNVLHANRTFCYLARKMEIDHRGDDTKNIGDIFEAIVGAYYTEKGFEAVHLWASRVYDDLVHVASVAFDDCLRDIELSGAAEDPNDSPSKGKGKGRRRPSCAQHPQPSLAASQSTPARGSSYIAAETSTPRTPLPTSRRGIRSHVRRPPSPPPGSASASPEESSRIDEHMSSRHPFHSLADSDDEPLPEFWEKITPPDGCAFFVNHKTKETTWDDPRHTVRPPSMAESDDDDDPQAELSWRARLMAGSQDDVGHRNLTDDTPNPSEPFPDLSEEGYTRDDEAFAGVTALPDFWEERQGQDGWVYYIDHVDSRIIRKAV